MNLTPLLVSFISSSIAAFACTCVTQANSTAKTLMADDALVLRGTVIERRVLPPRADMHGRGRYAITFRVVEYWKGTPDQTVVIYGLDPGTDCLGDGAYQVGKEYLVFVSEQRSRDVRLDDFLWYGWKDILPEGTAMLVPDTACKPGGEVSKVRSTLDQLGTGRVPAEGGKR